MNFNLQTNNILYSLNNFNSQSNVKDVQLPNHPTIPQSPNITNTNTFNFSQCLLKNSKNVPNLFLCQKLMKKNLYLKSLDMPKQFSDKLIKKLMKDKRFALDNLMTPNKNTNFNLSNQSKRTRIPFTKEEDEKIKQLVERFGSGHWELISHFMERRTAKQCRDRYTNYLVPGVFQGEWMKEEDKLLIQLYEKIGPKWSILQRYIPYRSATNIKNRWHYFLAKQNPDKNNAGNEDEMNLKIKSEELNEKVDQNEFISIENEIKDQNHMNINEEVKDRDCFFKLGNETLENRNNIFDFENEWIFNEFSPEQKSLIDK